MQLILGTAGLAKSYGLLGRNLNSPSPGEWVGALHDLGKFGFSAIDTAPVYGEAESIIGESNPTVSIHTKLNPGLEPANSLEDSLKRLRKTKVDVLYFHERYVGDKSQALAVDKLSQLRGRLFDRLGASIYDEEEFENALQAPEIDVIQVPFSVLDRRFNGAKVAKARSVGKVVIARSVFLQGLLINGLEPISLGLGQLRPSIEEFFEVCEGWNTSTIDAAIAFVKSRRDFYGLILGVRSPEQLRGLAHGYEATAAKGLLEDLERLSPLSWPAMDPRTWEAQ